MIKEHALILNKINPELEPESRLLGGMSNYTYLVKNKKGEKFTFRVIGDFGEYFTNFKTEHFNLNIVDELAINSKTIYFNSDTGVKLSKYIKGTVKHDEINYVEVAKMLKKLHNSGLKLALGYDHLKRLDDYEKLHKNFDNDYEYLKGEFIKLFHTHLKKHVKYPCHNDAQSANIIHTDSKCFLLDWEFAGMNDYIYDIASFGNRDFEMSIMLLASYESDVEFEHLVRLYGWRMFQCLQWFNVANAKHQFGLSDKLEIEFDVVAVKYLNLANKMHEDLKKYL